MRSLLYVSALLSILFARNVSADKIKSQHFDRVVAPLLAQRCLSCHSGDEAKGDLNLSTHDSAMKGGESGVVIAPNELSHSLLWEYIESDEMPPKKPLTADEKEILRTWIEGGAVWGTESIDAFRLTTDARAGTDWWSLQQLQKPQLPPVTRTGWTTNPIDAFVETKLIEMGLAPSPAADRRTLIRRLSFDLLGLPPTPSEVDAFLADTSTDAYERLVDRLLNSPHYGERWARHWLDIVRFGESNGFEYDQPRDNAWHYRNWVITALNQDMPYDEFVRLQLAGDLIDSDNYNAAAATGFLVAGPHNTTLPANDVMRMSMAQDELEDLVGIVSQTFLGLTTNCARCHDHKFDPISQREYYQFAATLTGVTHGQRKMQIALSDDQQQRLTAIDARVGEIALALDSIEQPIRDAILAERKRGNEAVQVPPVAFAAWEFDQNFDDSIGSLQGISNGDARIEDGCLVLSGTDAWVATAPLAIDLREKTIEAWVQLNDLDQRGGGVISVQTLDGATFDAIVFGEREPQKWMAGSNGFVRTMPFNGNEESEATQRVVHVAIVYLEDGTIVGYRDGKRYGEPYRPRELQTYHANQTQIVFGLRHSPAAANKMLSGRIQRAQLYDRALSDEEVASSAGVVDLNHVSQTQIIARFSPDQRSRFEQLSADADALRSEKESLANLQTVELYTCVSQAPGITRLLKRGDVQSPAETIIPAGLSAVVGVNPDFSLAADAGDADRRLRLAEWITHRDNPLFARVIVNRLWQYHFGSGLVTTASDFGFNGGTPSHPELLEWLAMTLRENGYRLKSMHRLMVTSAAYRQVSTRNVQSAKLDTDNRWLWRKSPLRLEAEEVRDAILVASRQLNSTVGGVGYRDVRHFEFKGSNFYESIDESASDSLRRTLYRFAPRGGHNPFLDTFDCPDPSTTTPRRATTITPMQALALMNNDLVFQMADKFATRVQREVGETGTTVQQINAVYAHAYGRTANKSELDLGCRFVEKNGLASYCRVIFNSNEFLYVP